MFKSDITQTYDHFDASAEILIMLIGSFLLGCLLCWLLRQFLIRNNTVNVSDGYFDTISPRRNNHANENSQVTSKEEIKPNNSSNGTEAVNILTPQNITSDFKIINGITPQIEDLLRSKNINSYSDLRDINNTTLNEILSSSVAKNSTKQVVKTWSHQATLAAKGDWRKLSEYQDFVEQAMLSEKEKHHDKDTNYANSQKDKLQKIKGIGPQIEKILNGKGIHTFKQLKKADAETLKEYISNADIRFKNNQTSTWSHQASMAEKGQWKELAVYQEFMDDIKIDSENLAATIKKSNKTTVPSATFKKSIKPDSSSSEFSSDNTEKKQSFLNYDFNLDKTATSNSADTDTTNLDNAQKATDSSILDNIDNLTSNNKSYPDDLKIDQEDTHNKSSHQSKRDSKNSEQKDNLKLIEGIGPKIEEVLNNANILTFNDLKQSNRDLLKSVLTEAGSQYRMHEPETWPIQAEMAHNKNWDKLEEYQQFLTGGRE